ncbi:hypothetical protein ACHQM5_026009 [Ranunculus cassubicifolius]
MQPPSDPTTAAAIIDDEDLEEEEDDDDEEEDLESDDEIDEDDQSHRLPDAAIAAIPISTAEIQSESPPPDQKRQRIDILTTTPTTAVAVAVHQPSSISIIPTPESVQKPSAAFDDSRRLFQRLWTDEDEIGLLQGFLDYTSQRGGFKNSAYHHDTAPFYDQIKSKLQLDFNKNQLVEKLRRLKKKYRNVMSRINSGKDFSFKTPHDQATFEISKKIWCGIDGGALMDDEDQGNGNPNLQLQISHNSGEVNGKASASSSRKRSRSRPPAPTPLPPLAAAVPVVAEENVSAPPISLNYQANSSLPTVIEETVRSCLGPLFKELMLSVVNGAGNSRGFRGMDFNLTPLNFGGNSSHNFLSGTGDNKEMMDEKWRKQQILELEVYAKRVELVQDQIKLALEELRSPGNQ